MLECVWRQQRRCLFFRPQKTEISMQLKSRLSLFLGSINMYLQKNELGSSKTTQRTYYANTVFLTVDAYSRSLAELGNRGQNITSLPPEVVGDSATPPTEEAIHSALAPNIGWLWL